MTIETSMEPINVVGLVIHAAPGSAERVCAALGAMPGVEVHAETGDGRIVATAIDCGGTLAIDQLALINRVPGVVSAMLAYHQIDDPRHAGASVADVCDCSPAVDASNHTCCPQRA